MKRGLGLVRQRLAAETTTLWDFPHQSPAGRPYGAASFQGVTPSALVWNLLVRYSAPGDWVLDPMAGSGTTLDVARELRRRVLGFDLRPQRRDIHRADARHLPVPNDLVQLAFADPPYGDNVVYSTDPRCLGRLRPDAAAFYEALREVALEMRRVLRPRGYAVYLISDAYRAAQFTPVGLPLFATLQRLFRPVDIVAVARHGDRSLNPTWEHRSRTENFLLRGFRYLLIFQKEGEGG